MRSHSALAVFVGAVFAVAFLVHCGVSPAGADDTDGGAATDAGTVTDGGSAACDCPAAPKPVVLTANCDHEEVTVDHSSIADGTVVTTHYAVIDAPNAVDDGTMLVSAMTCGHTVNGQPAGPRCLTSTDHVDCPADMTYSPDCVAAKGLVQNGKIVVLCGTSRVDPGFDDTSDMYSTAKVILP